MIDLRCCDVADLLADIEPGSVAGVCADPPWSYANAGTRGCAGNLYDGLPNPQIAEHLDATWDACGSDAYLIVWCTWPKLGEWFAVHESMRWKYKTGGAWVKSNGFGIGFHVAGDSEFALIYTKGSPRPAEGRQKGGWHEPRGKHSEKPQGALGCMVKTVAQAGGLILDPYAGETASLARACQRLGRNYIGCEIDPERHARALRRLAGESAAQAAMVGQERLFG